MLQDALDWIDEHRVIAISALNSSILITLAVLLAAASMDEGTKTAWAASAADVEAPEAAVRSPAPQRLSPGNVRHAPSRSTAETASRAQSRSAEPRVSPSRSSSTDSQRQNTTTAVPRSIRRPQANPTVSRPRAVRTEASARGLPTSR